MGARGEQLVMVRLGGDSRKTRAKRAIVAEYLRDECLGVQTTGLGENQALPVSPYKWLIRSAYQIRQKVEIQWYNLAKCEGRGMLLRGYYDVGAFRRKKPSSEPELSLVYTHADLPRVNGHHICHIGRGLFPHRGFRQMPTCRVEPKLRMIGDASLLVCHHRILPPTDPRLM